MQNRLNFGSEEGAVPDGIVIRDILFPSSDLRRELGEIESDIRRIITEAAIAHYDGDALIARAVDDVRMFEAESEWYDLSPEMQLLAKEAKGKLCMVVGTQEDVRGDLEPLMQRRRTIRSQLRKIARMLQSPPEWN